MDFYEYCQSNSFDDCNDKKDKVNKNTSNKKYAETLNKQDEIKEKISQYQNMSNDQLMTELLKETNIQKQNGHLDNKKLDSISEQLKPMLNKEQQSKLDEILKMLR